MPAISPYVPTLHFVVNSVANEEIPIPADVFARLGELTLRAENFTWTAIEAKELDGIKDGYPGLRTPPTDSLSPLDNETQSAESTP